MTNDTYRDAVQEIKDRVFSYSARLLGDVEEAKDVAQEALVRLWEHRESIPDTARARAWTLRTAHNLAMDRLRQRSARPQVAEEVLEFLPTRGADPERRASGRESVRQLEKALATLGESERSVVLMREVHGLSYDEMAGILGAPLGTIKARLHRGRERLRELLREAGVRP